MTKPRIFRGLPLLTGAAVGVFVGHTIAYLVVFPSAAERAREIADSGHGYWPDAIRLLVQFVAFSMATLAVRTLRERARASGELTDPPGELFRWLMIRLGALQAAGFIVMEVTERLVAGDPIRASLTPRLLLVGIGVQLLVAAAISLILIVISRVVEHLTTLARAPFGRASTPAMLFAPTLTPARQVRPPGAWGTRGPPATLLD